MSGWGRLDSAGLGTRLVLIPDLTCSGELGLLEGKGLPTRWARETEAKLGLFQASRLKTPTPQHLPERRGFKR